MRGLNIFSTLAVMLCWPVYISLFLRGTGAPKAVDVKDSRSIVGIVLQFSGAAVMWRPRPLFSSLFETFPSTVAFPLMAIVFSIGAVWFSHIALKALGKQWSFVAEVGGGHRLIREGIYGVVRHPLYVCFFALTLATGIVWADLQMLLIGVVLFVAGVAIRVRVEERLLRNRFGNEFDEYVRDVAAFVPGLHFSGTVGREK